MDLIGFHYEEQSDEVICLIGLHILRLLHFICNDDNNKTIRPLNYNREYLNGQIVQSLQINHYYKRDQDLV